MLARRDRDGVLDAEVVAAGVGPGDGCLSGEEAGHGEPRQRRIALDRELGVQIAERRGRVVDARAELPHVGSAQLIDHVRLHRPHVGRVHVVLRPPEVAIDPRNVAGPGQRLRIDAFQEEVADGHGLRRCHLVIELQRRLVGLQRIRRADFIEAVRQIRRRHVLVLNRFGRDVEAARRNDVAGERQIRQRIVRLARRLREVPRPLERGRHHRGVAIVGLLLPQPRVADEEERLVPGERASGRAAELIPIERIVGRRRPGRRPARRVQALVAEELEGGAVKDVGA